MTRLTPINCAEAVFEPFFDPQLSSLDAWEFHNGEPHGLHVWQSWCWVAFEWSRPPQDGIALAMSRHITVSCHGYDRLIVSLMAPPGSTIRIKAATDAGHLSAEAKVEGNLKQEIPLDLQGSQRLLHLSIEIMNQEGGVQTGWFNWIGLQNTQLLPYHLQQWENLEPAWEGYLHADGFIPTFTPTIGLLVNAAELAILQNRHKEHIQHTGTSPFILAGQLAMQQDSRKTCRRVRKFLGGYALLS